MTERLGGASTWSYDYDEAGNTTTRPGPDGGAQSLAWDGEGRLEAVTGDGTAAEFVYTADGDRVVRTEGGETTVYLPGGQEATVTTGGTVEATRFYSFAGVTVALRTEGGLGGVESLVTGHHGTVLARVHNTTRQLVKTLTDPFGNLRGGGAPPAGRGLMNKVVDESTGLTQVGARYYDQLLGRFISVDPIMDLTDPQQWHGYAYANNNPVTWDDPTGLFVIKPVNPIMFGLPKPPAPPETTGGSSGGNGGSGGASGGGKPPTVTPASPPPAVTPSPPKKPSLKERLAKAKEWTVGALEATDDFLKSEEFAKGLKIAGTVAGVAAAGACIVATAGACFVAGAVALGASAATNATLAYRGDQTVGQAAGNFAIDLTVGRIPGAREISRTQIMRQGRHGPLSDYARRVRDPDQKINLTWEKALNHRAGTSVSRFSGHLGAGYMATTDANWIQ